MKITIFGTGYVGLVTGTCLADIGNDVLCVDVDSAKIEGLKRGEMPIFEPGLEELVRANAASGRLRFTTDAALAVEFGEIQFIAVGTPPDEDGSADLKYVLAVARTIGEHMSAHKVVVNKSTVPVGTADKVREQIDQALLKRAESFSFDIVSNPEFLKEGAAIDDCMKPDRIVIGSSNAQSIAKMKALYAPLNRNHERVVVMDVRSAELTKYAANAMLATKISFMNEIANIAERVGADVESVRLGIGADPRIGYHFIYPGIGYGGSCFPKDVQALERTAGQYGYEARILGAVEAVNRDQKSALIRKMIAHYGSLVGRTFAIWGLAFKPNTDDLREAPSRVIIEALLAAGASVRAYDPEAAHEAKRLFENHSAVHICERAFEAVSGADALLIVTEWKEFWTPDFAKLKAELKDGVIFDGRNIFKPEVVRAAGLTYFGIGRL